MTSLATAFVEARLDTSSFRTDIRRGMSHSSVASGIADEGKKAGKGYTSAFGSTLKIGATLAAGFAAVKGVQFFGDAIGEAREAQKATALTAAVIKSTGGAANVTAKQVGDLANAISLKTGIDDEAIQKGENLLLTFKNVRNEVGKGNDIFNQATSVVTDMSAALGQDMKAGSIQLGKALNDPIKGITALSRVGVTFTDQQKEQITTLVESGNSLKAQKIILGELNSEFGGAAEAQATAGEKAKVAFDNLKESVGTALLPVLDSLETMFVEKIVPALYQFGGFVQSDVIPVIKKMAGFIKDNSDLIRPLAIGLGGLAVAVGVVSAAVGLFNLILAANPISLVVIALAALTAGLIIAYKRSDTFRRIVDGAFTATKAAARALVDFFRAAWPTISAVIQRVMDFIRGYLQGVFDIYRGIFRTALALLKGDWSGAWDGIKEILRGAWQVLRSILSLQLDIVKGLLGRAWDVIENGAERAWNGIVRTIKAAFSVVKKAVGTPIFFVLDTIINDKLIGAFNKVADWVKAPNIPDIPTGGIPHFAKGGNTGPGSKYQPAGIVHAGEHVWTQEEMARFPGGHKAMEQMRKSLLRGYAAGGRVWPLPGGTWSTYPGHDGIDLNAGDDYGKPFLAAASGQISYVGWNRGYGDAIFERGNYGELVYGHSSRPLVRSGQSVKAGQILGLVGSTGNSTGPHLHFGFPGGTPAQALAFLSGASTPHIGGIGSQTNVSTWDAIRVGLGIAADKATGNPLAYLRNAVYGSLDKIGDGPLASILKGLPRSLVSSLGGYLQDRFGASGNLTRDEAIQLGARVHSRDNGGLLAPGYTMVYNGTGAYETVRTSKQEAALRRGGSDRALVHVEHMHVRDEETAARAIERKQREALAIAGGS